jgi:hypothetical protein
VDAYSSKPDTLKHIRQVQENIGIIIETLRRRADDHDDSKLHSPEVEYFDEYTPKLAGCTYGSEEYKQFLAELKVALNHHYGVSRHHPEHFENGIRGMNLVDLVEMICDWYAATKRHNDGDLMKSIAINQERFGYSDDVKALLENTYKDLFWCEGCDVPVCREFPGTCRKTSTGKEYVEKNLRDQEHAGWTPK